MNRTTGDVDAPHEAGAARPLTVSELTAQVKTLVEGSFPAVWVTGEISNLARPRSGHIYFTLKDPRAQLRAVIWRGTAARLRFDLEDGLEVICRGGLDVYAPRGSYQLTVSEIQPRGMGALELALRRLQEKLAREGLFDVDRKRSLPAFPRTIAVVTSPTGAAIRDFLQVVRRRWHGVRVLVIPARVQGEGAASEIVGGIRAAHKLAMPIDVLVVTRGGGSLEDLWAFNEEPVVRAVAAARIPVVSAVGHEIDVTLTDLAADLRALTPSEAAERVVPASRDVRAILQTQASRLGTALRRRVELARGRVDAVADHRVFRRPLERLHELGRRLDELAARADRSVAYRAREARNEVDAMAGKLESLSPLAVLHRGYSVTFRADGGPPVRAATELAVGQPIMTRFGRGLAHSRVEQIKPEARDGRSAVKDGRREVGGG